MSATRGLGNLLRLIKNENLVRKPQMKTLCEAAIGKLLDCACKVANMKVRWNACYALGNAMKNDQLFTCFNGWQVRLQANKDLMCIFIKKTYGFAYFMLINLVASQNSTK